MATHLTLKEPSLGKLISVHGTSPVYVQRAAVVATLSFVFFMAMLIAFYIRQHFGYFLLSTAFLIVFIFTMIGWWMQRRNAVQVYTTGITRGKSILIWDQVVSADLTEKFGLVIITKDGDKFTVPRSIDSLNDLTALVQKRIELVAEKKSGASRPS